MRAPRFVSVNALQEPPKTWTDLIGTRVGRLVVMGYTGIKTRHNQKQITCRCDCGCYVHVAPANLRRGATTSCGCAHSEIVAIHNKQQGTHGDTREGKITPEYRTWQAMINRCCKPNHAAYKWYGARGITVYEKWRHDFAAFLTSVGRRPSRRHSLDRRDNDGNYEPGNVRWALPTEQARNQQTTRRYAFENTWLTLGEIAELTGIPRERLYQRVVRSGWTLSEAVSVPVTRTVSDTHDLYGRWYQMVARCTNPLHERYKDYGGRGIVVCARWRQSLDNFVADVGALPTNR